MLSHRPTYSDATTEKYIDFAEDALIIQQTSTRLDHDLNERRAKEARIKCQTIIAAATRLYAYCVAVELQQNPAIKVK